MQSYIIHADFRPCSTSYIRLILEELADVMKRFKAHGTKRDRIGFEYRFFKYRLFIYITSNIEVYRACKSVLKDVLC